MLHRSVSPNTSQSFTAVLAPTAIGPANGTLTITSNDPTCTTEYVAKFNEREYRQAVHFERMRKCRRTRLSPVLSKTQLPLILKSGKLYEVEASRHLVFGLAAMTAVGHSLLAQDSQRCGP